MNKNKTELVIILDRSGSMASIKNDIENGFNLFLTEQRKLPGECLVSLYQFDSVCEIAYSAKNLKEVTNIVIHPRGSTALIDTVCRAIKEVGKRLSDTAESDRPGKVIFHILTDGEENASREYSISTMKEMVKEQTEKYSWEFVFLGTNIDAISTGAHYGVSFGKSLSFTQGGIEDTFKSLSTATAAFRSGCDYNFSAAERLAASK